MTQEMNSLDSRLHARFVDNARACQKELGYNPTRAIQMIKQHGAADAAHMMVLMPDGADGFARCWESGRLDLTVEYVILDDPSIRRLFTADVLEVAKKRLEDARPNPPRIA